MGVSHLKTSMEALRKQRKICPPPSAIPSHHVIRRSIAEPVVPETQPPQVSPGLVLDLVHGLAEGSVAAQSVAVHTPKGSPAGRALVLRPVEG